MRIQALKQQQSLEQSDAPIGTSSITDGVPKMHPLKSSNPVFKATSLLHGIRIRGLKLPGLKLPRI